MTTYRWSFLEDVLSYQAAGFRGVGVWRKKLADFGEERGSELLRECGMAVSSFWCAGGFTGADGESFQAAIDDALDALRTAAEIEAGCLVVVSGARGGHTLSHARRLLCEALRILGDAAAAYNIQVAVQPMHRLPVERWSFLNSLDATIATLEQCAHPRVGLVFDTFQLGRDPGLQSRIPALVPWTRLVALCDGRGTLRTDQDRSIPGTGRLPLAEFVEKLEAAGYRGSYDVQVLSDECWKSDYRSTLAECRTRVSTVCASAVPAPRIVAPAGPHGD